jgi:hypothetical protein
MSDERNVTAAPPAAETTSGARHGFARHYGARPWHLLSLLASFVLAGYAVSRLLDDLPVLLRIGIWFIGAAVVWDLVLGPVMALVDRGLHAGLARRPRRLPLLNYVRVPALLSALLLVVWAPLILQRSASTYQAKTGLTTDPYLERWLAVTAVLVVASAAAYALATALAIARARRHG